MGYGLFLKRSDILCNYRLMIKLILNSLKYANGETENIRIAQGKYKLPTTLKEGYKALKQEIKWRQ